MCAFKFTQKCMDIGMEAFKCDIADVLQKNDRTVLQKLVQSCQEFRSRVAAKVEEWFVYEKNCTKQTSINTKKMSELQKEINTVKTNIDNTVLQQKIIDKKITNVIKSQESSQKDLDKAKTKMETLSLKMMDIELEIEERKRKKVLQCDAIKRACNIYKTNLDINIEFGKEKDRQCIKISFFTYNEATRNKYFVLLSCSKDGFKVEQVEPKLNKKGFNEFSNILVFSEHSKVSDITLFLCQVRNIHLKHLYESKKKGIK